MNAKLKQQVLGLVVILAVIAVTLPILLHRSAATSKQSSSVVVSTITPTLNTETTARELSSSATAPVITATNAINDSVAAQQTTAVTLARSDTAPSAVELPEATLAQIKPQRASAADQSLASSPKTAVQAHHSARFASRVAMHRRPVVRHTAHHHLAHEGHDKSSQEYTIQLGVFSNAANASRLVESLRSHGFDGYVKRLHRGRDTLQAVFVGPEPKLNQAKVLQRRIAKRYYLHGVIKHYHS